MPDFRTYTWKLYKEALRVGFKVLEVMGVALQLKVLPVVTYRISVVPLV